MKKLNRFVFSLCFFWILFCSSQLAAQTNNNPEPAEKKSSQSDRTVDRYLLMNKNLEYDKERLANLLKDSIWAEKEYKKVLIKFEQINQPFEAVSLPYSDSLILLQQRMITDLILDFLLDRRQTIQKLKFLLDNKIPVEEALVEFFMKDEDAVIVEIMIKDKSVTDTYDADSSAVKSITYDRNIAKEEQKLFELRAQLNYAQFAYNILNQLNGLHQQDTTTVSHSWRLISERLGIWKNIQDKFDQSIQVLTETDSLKDYRRFLQSAIKDMEVYAGYMHTILRQDSIISQELKKRMNGIESGQSLFSERIVKTEEQLRSQINLLSYLKSPLSHVSLHRFIVERGPRVIVTLLIIVILWFVIRWIIPMILRGITKKSTDWNRDQRIKTLTRASRGVLNLLMTVAVLLFLLAELGINISVLVGSAAIFSVAIAFGTQSLVKDYFTGFVILVENQYRIGNVVKINDTSGTVEAMTMRMTTLRDLEGIAHFVPHGEIRSVSNLTHGWSRVVLEIGVAYKENVDQVMEVIMQVATDLRNDPGFKKKITKDPELLGLDKFSDSAVIIKLLIQTIPMEQWAVKREYLRRIKNRFDELGIEIPFPHRTIYFGNQLANDSGN